MSKINKLKKLSLLFDAYQNMLTDIQRDVFKQYYLEDYSLSEIANNTKTTRTSVSLKLKNIEEKLIDLEEKIGFVKKVENLNKKIENLKKQKE